MKNIWRIFRADLKCLRTNVLAGVVVFGLLLTPALYAWFNILGFWAPYEETGNLEVAVANSDEGYQSTLIPTKLNAGEMIIASLRGDEEFKWVFTDENEAIEGTKSGKYFAALVIPKEFSADLMTIFSGNVKQAEITYYTNQKINAVAPKVTTEGATALSKEINQKFSEVVADIGLGVVSDLTDYLGGDGVQNFGRGMSEQLGELSSGLDLAAQEARTLADLMDSTGALLVKSSDLLGTVQGENAGLNMALSEGATGVDQSKTAVDAAAGAMNEALGTLESAAEDVVGKLADFETTEEKNAAQEALATMKEQITALQGSVASLQGRVAQLDSEFGTLKTEVMTINGQIVDASTKLSGAARSLADNLSATGVSFRTMAGQLDDSGAKLAAIREDLTKALDSGDLAKVREIIGSNPTELASFIAAPAELERIPVYGVADNGSAMAPFYTSLSIWVGSIFLVALMETEVGKKRLAELEAKAAHKVTPAQLYLGRYLIFLLFALIQATIVCFGDIFFLGVQYNNIGLFMLTGWVCALVFSSIVYTLTLSFSKIGESLAIILVVLQVASAGGIFPVVLSAPIFQAIYPWLPFVYSMNAFEGAIAGVYENQFTTSILTLLAFVIPMLILGLVLRRPIIKLNDKFVEKMEETGVM